MVFITTPWEYHATMVIECMNNGIRSGCEVPIATTEGECKRIYETYKKTGIDTCIMENVCWREDVMAILNMKRMGLFGKINYASCGYMHDLRGSLTNKERYMDWWRGEHYKNRAGDNYPTHGLGPVQNWLDINKGNRMVKLTSYSNNSLGIVDLLKKTKHTINKYYDKDFKTGDVVKTIIQTVKGELIEITLNTTSARPYSLDFCLQGTYGLWDRRLGLHQPSSIYLETTVQKNEPSNYFIDGDISCEGTHAWGNGDKYVKKYRHPLYVKILATFGHGGMDWYMYNSLIGSVKNNTKFEISVADSLTMSIITDISRKSISQGNKCLYIPDFTEGFWMNDTSLFENCFYINSYDIISHGDNSYYIIITDYSSYLHEKNNFHLYHYSDTFTEPLQYTYNSILNANNTFAVSNIDNVPQHKYLAFNKIRVRDDHYMIISTVNDVKYIEFFFKMDKQIYETQDYTKYWCYLFDGRPGNVDTYIAFRKKIVVVGKNIEKIIFNNVTIVENIGQTMFNSVKKYTWNSIKIYLTVPITDDISLFSRYNNKEDFDGAIANLKINNINDATTNKYDFISYNKENKFLNLITNVYDLKIFGNFTTNIIHDINTTETLYNSNTENIANHGSSDIILFFKRDNIDIINDKLILY